MAKIFKNMALAALVSMAVGAGSASAATLTPGSVSVTSADANFSWIVDFSCTAAAPCVGGTPPGDLAAKAIFTLTSVVVGPANVRWAIDLTLANVSASGVAGFLTALGFAADPTATMTAFLNNASGTNWSGGNGIIPGFASTELCVRDGTGCGDVSNNFMTAGVSDTMSFVLRTSGLNDSLTLTDFAVRMAGAGPADRRYQFGGTVAPIPLPAAGGMLLAGLAGLGLIRRKRKAA
jgi:hypothetical protein